MNRTVLIADADANTRTSLEILVRREGWEPLLARDGAGALALIRDAHPDVALLDAALPGRNGFEVCQAVQEAQEARDANDESARTRILVLSARARATEAAQAQGVGAAGCLAKPFSTRELARRVRELMA